MSGGSYNYLYQQIDDLERTWPENLEHMARRCREWARFPELKKYVSAEKKEIPATLEDRAHIMARAMMLEAAAARLRRAIEAIKPLAGVMHDIEWVASCDYGVDALMGPVKE